MLPLHLPYALRHELGNVVVGHPLFKAAFHELLDQQVRLGRPPGGTRPGRSRTRRCREPWSRSRRAPGPCSGLAHRVVGYMQVGGVLAHGGQLLARLVEPRVYEVRHTVAQLHPQRQVALVAQGKGGQCPSLPSVPSFLTLRFGRRRSRARTAGLGHRPGRATANTATTLLRWLRRAANADASIARGASIPHPTKPSQNTQDCSPASSASNGRPALAAFTVTAQCRRRERLEHDEHGVRDGGQPADRREHSRRGYAEAGAQEHDAAAARERREQEQHGQPRRLPQAHGNDALQEQPRVHHHDDGQHRPERFRDERGPLPRRAQREHGFSERHDDDRPRTA